MRLWMTPPLYATESRPINARRWLARAGLVALFTSWGCRVLVDFDRRPADDVSAAGTAGDSAAGVSDPSETTPPEPNGASGNAASACVLGRAVLGVCRLPMSLE